MSGNVMLAQLNVHVLRWTTHLNTNRVVRYVIPFKVRQLNQVTTEVEG